MGAADTVDARYTIPPTSGVRPKAPRSYRGWDWPDDIPLSYEETYEQFKDQVVRTLHCKMQYRRDVDDLVQHVWAQLLHAQLLDRFLDRSLAELPSSLDGCTACSYLGIEWDQWVDLAEDLTSYGDPADSTNRYHLLDVLECDYYLGSAPRSYLRVFPRGLSRSYFTGYLTSSVINIYRNYCRTHSRRFALDLLTGDDVLTSAGAVASTYLPRISSTSTPISLDLLVDALHYQERGGQLPAL